MRLRDMRMTLQIFALTALIAIPLAMALWVLDRLEKHRKQRASESFLLFAGTHPDPGRNLRGMRRVLLPPDLEVSLTALSEDGRRLRGRLRDLSLSGAAVVVRGSRRHLKPGMEVKAATFVTPLNRFRIERMRLVRIGTAPERHLTAFQFQRIDSKQFDELQRFLGYLERFQKNETAGH